MSSAHTGQVQGPFQPLSLQTACPWSCPGLPFQSNIARHIGQVQGLRCPSAPHELRFRTHKKVPPSTRSSHTDQVLAHPCEWFYPCPLSTLCQSSLLCRSLISPHTVQARVRRHMCFNHFASHCILRSFVLISPDLIAAWSRSIRSFILSALA